MDAKLLTLLVMAMVEMGSSGCANTVCLPKKEVPCCPAFDFKTCFKSGSILPNKQTNIYCKPLYLTDIDYCNETISSVSSGDSDRWMFQTVNSPNGNHLLIKPTENNISTNAMVVTSDNTYHLNLIANNKNASSNTYQVNQSKMVSTTTRYDSNYTITNKTSWFGPMPNWAPTCVYNDGTHVYIDMPDAIKNMKAPLLYDLDEDDGYELMNYYFRDGKYIVEHLFERGVLISKSGKTTQKVLIEYHKD